MEIFHQVCSSDIELMHCLKQMNLCAKNEESHQSNIREELVFFSQNLLSNRTPLRFAILSRKRLQNKSVCRSKTEDLFIWSAKQIITDFGFIKSRFMTTVCFLKVLLEQYSQLLLWKNKRNIKWMLRENFKIQW